jgi:serine/threonine-protein kinase
VALKVLRSELVESLGASQSLKEVRLTATLSHPHIVPLLDSGEHERQLFFVLPCMEGGTLRERMNRERQLTLAMARFVRTTVVRRGAGDAAGRAALERPQRDGP